MPPKKPKDKEPPKQQTEVQSLYKRREPLPPEEPPDVSEREVAWKDKRNAFCVPLPEWDTEAVNTTEWKPNETETLYSNTSFASSALPEEFAHFITAWRRAPVIYDASGETSAPEEPAPEALPLSEGEPAAPVAPDPKAKPAKPDPKAKAKAGKVEEPPTAKTTVQQFAECSYSGEVCVVSTAEFRSRELHLNHDDAAPALTQAIASQFAIIAEHRRLIPRGYFLWELIYPQGEDGVPLFNPHGKYIVRLYVQGRWRQVLIDDVVPAGNSNVSGSFAAVLPSSGLPGVLWPQLLAKALLRAFQADLSQPMLPAITALTGWLPFRLPLTWESVQRSLGTRSFVCLRSQSQVENEELSIGGQVNLQQMPRLVGQGAEALCEFLACELEEEPRQVRLKAATWRPAGGAVRKAVLNAESEAEDEEEEEDKKLADEGLYESEHEEQDQEEDDEERGTQQTPSGGEQTALQSARSKEEGAGGTNEEGGGTEGGNTEAVEEAVNVPWVNPWPETLPPQMMMKSVLEEYRRELVDGYWVGFNLLEAQPPQLRGQQPRKRTSVEAPSFVTYMPPGTILKAVHDTTWADGRRQPYVPQPAQLLRLRLVPEVEQRRKMSNGPDPSEQPKTRGPAWHRAVFIYEPLRLDHTFAEAKEMPIGPGTTTLSCFLQSVNCWQTAPLRMGTPPECIHLSVSDGPSGNGSGTASHSVLLPPGEHWYLVQDDAARAGSTLSAYVEGTLLNLDQSSVDFGDPARALEDQEAFVTSLESTEYPAQKGFAIWAKAELTLRGDVAAAARCLQLLSYVDDPELWPYLQLTFMQLTEREDGDPESRCAGWSVITIARSPLLQLMSLPLRPVAVGSAGIASPTAAAVAAAGESGSEFGGSSVPSGAAQGGEAGGGQVRYVVMLEASTPSAVKAGAFRLQLWLPPRPGGWGLADDSAALVEAPAAEDGEEPEAPAAPFSLKTLKTDTILRWSGETAPNSKGIVLCERLTVPMGAGDVVAMLRVAVSGLPKAFLCASLVAQLPPKEDMRPKGENGEAPEPLQPGALIDPREYGGRRNWLSSCRTVVEESGVEVVVFPHVILCEGSTYLFYGLLDPHKGPDSLEGGEWLLEAFGSGEVEAGADTMELDLEELVRRSWEDPNADPAQPTRAERAAASRRKWLIDHGIEPPPEPVEEEADPEALDAAAKGKKPGKEAPKAKAAPASAAAPAEELSEDPALKAAREAAELEEALQRADQTTHTNVRIAEFVHLHTKVEPVLDMEDPHTIAPDPPLEPLPGGDAGALEAEEDAMHGGEEDPEAPARRALGMLGLQELRRSEVEASAARWEKASGEMEEAKERNKTLLEELAQWREDHAGMKMQFMEAREALCEKLKIRMEKHAALKDVAGNAESAEVAPLQQALQEAEEAGVGTWDKDLIEMAGMKVRFFEALVALKANLERPPEEVLAEPDARQEFAKGLDDAKDAREWLLKCRAPLPQDLGEEELFAQAEGLLLQQASEQPQPQ